MTDKSSERQREYKPKLIFQKKQKGINSEVFMNAIYQPYKELIKENFPSHHHTRGRRTYRWQQNSWILLWAEASKNSIPKYEL